MLLLLLAWTTVTPCTWESVSPLCLQYVLEAAARFLTGSRKLEHITPILASPHWLPVNFRIQFKVLLFVYKALHRLASSYLSDLLTPYTPPRSLRTSHCWWPRLLCSGSRLWNKLPHYVRSAPFIMSTPPCPSDRLNVVYIFIYTCLFALFCFYCLLCLYFPYVL